MQSWVPACAWMTGKKCIAPKGRSYNGDDAVADDR